MAISTFSTFFTNINDSIIDTVTQLIPEIFGLAPSVKNQVHPRYKVTIVSNGGNRLRPWSIEGVLQEKIVIKVASKWEEIGLFQIGNNELLSLAFNKIGLSLVNTFSSRRRWTGSSPINISMKLKFEAEANTFNEVTKACAKLQGLALPSGGLNALGGKLFLRPPGPNPWGTTDLGEKISIRIGQNWLSFDSVIVEDVTTEFENRMSIDGPIGALVTINLSTYELMTKESLETAYGASIFGNAINNIPTNVNNLVVSTEKISPDTTDSLVNIGNTSGANNNALPTNLQTVVNGNIT